MYPPAVINRWAPVVTQCKEVTREFAPVFSQLLENQYREFIDPSNSNRFVRVGIPILRNVFPHLGVNHLVRVQGLVHGMMMKFVDSNLTISPVTLSRSLLLDKVYPEDLVNQEDFKASVNQANAITNAGIIPACNRIIRNIDTLVLNEMLTKAKKFTSLEEAIQYTGASWVAANRNVIDTHPVFSKSVRKGWVFDNLYEGGYRSEIRPADKYFDLDLYSIESMSNDLVLVGYRGQTLYRSGLILGFGVPILDMSDLDPPRLGVPISVSTELAIDIDPKRFGVVTLKE